jgi:hypothetical protein
MSVELIPNNRGFGRWEISVYKPEDKIFTIEGYLYITKEHCIIFEDSKSTKTLLNIAFQNVAWVQLQKEEEEE